MQVDADTLALLANLGVTLKPGDSPLALIALARHVGDLQRRVDALEATKEAPTKRGIFGGRKAHR